MSISYPGMPRRSRRKRKPSPAPFIIAGVLVCLVLAIILFAASGGREEVAQEKPPQAPVVAEPARLPDVRPAPQPPSEPTSKSPPPTEEKGPKGSPIADPMPVPAESIEPELKPLPVPKVPTLPQKRESTKENPKPVSSEPSPSIKRFLEVREKYISETIGQWQGMFDMGLLPDGTEFKGAPTKAHRDALESEITALKNRLDLAGSILNDNGELAVGRIGVFFRIFNSPNLRVSQVISPKAALVSHILPAGERTRLFILTGVSTEGWVDDYDVQVDGLFEVTGTKKYETVTGGSNTAFVVEPFDAEQARPFMK